ncbi:hypothetical protein NDU88_010599 [Pleurodeles waltl]|uniref:Uncharacterized protein n=1 Tax=Pleurodeles waltl TaxID=8319 RepID=A0AAV7QUV8_PLEWA|nr:hypothetical protein NDU88_010599 [Pleurodeles waltl]
MVGNTIPHYEGPSVMQDQVAETLRQRCVHSDRMSRERRARDHDIRVGDLVLAKNQHPGGNSNSHLNQSHGRRAESGVPWSLLAEEINP